MLDHLEEDGGIQPAEFEATVHQGALDRLHPDPVVRREPRPDGVERRGVEVDRHRLDDGGAPGKVVEQGAAAAAEVGDPPRIGLDQSAEHGLEARLVQRAGGGRGHGRRRRGGAVARHVALR